MHARSIRAIYNESEEWAVTGSAQSLGVG